MSVQEQQLIAQLIEQQREAVREIVEAQRDLRAVLGESESIRQQELDALKAQLENAKQVYEEIVTHGPLDVKVMIGNSHPIFNNDMDALREAFGDPDL